MKNFVKYTLLILGVAAVLTFIFILIRRDFQPHYPCQDKNIQNDAAIKCYGIISIDGFGEGGFKYSIYDNVQLYPIADIRSYNDFRYINNKIYVIDQASHYAFDNINKEYDKYYFIDGQIKHYTSKTKEGMPKYFIVDTVTGNVSPYVSIDQIPESERSIFLELEKK